MTDTISPITSTITATTTNPTTSNPSASSVGIDQQTIAGNFNTFLQLLTTQLRNQNPLDPLDTNQFTQQLVQFASVEQQMKQNDQLSQLITIEKTAQTTTSSPSRSTSRPRRQGWRKCSACRQ